MSAPGEEPSAERLSSYTTLRLGGPAARLRTATTDEDIVAVTRAADRSGEPLLVLGGGSNLVVADAGFAGTVLRVATHGIEFDRYPDSHGERRVRVTIAAGESWDDVVALAVAEGLGGGLESLSGIPGGTGAVPVQNVGAYGVEIAQLLHSVSLLDRRTGEVRTVGAADLGLGYRTSVLKHRDDAVILRVTLELPDDPASGPIRYPELARALEVPLQTTVPAGRARDAVLALRRAKGMLLDPADHDTWSAGSFFTNPLLARSGLPAVQAATPARAVPTYPVADEKLVKLSAAWLIEQAGFAKGHPGPGGHAALSTKHTLALTNRGQATTADLLALARQVRDGVRETFGIVLEPEPVLVGCRL